MSKRGHTRTRQSPNLATRYKHADDAGRAKILIRLLESGNWHGYWKLCKVGSR